ncbi:thiamine pyrophosphate enzyme [Whalleya microplaca]|nr:thiamine pyrophosphate enzyme [Whalleya microplaca]
MASTFQLAEYLFIRLKQLDIVAIHGVAGDYNLALLDFIEPAGLYWVGNANELNAGYAADGYARIKGVGAIITTFGVGELSAINAIAGAYAERVAVVHIVGTPKLEHQDSEYFMHHNFDGQNFYRFAEMYAAVTVAQVSLRSPGTCPEEIDYVLRQCIEHSRPVYIQVPTDLVTAPVSAARLRDRISVPHYDLTQRKEDIMTSILLRIYNATRPVILVDGESRSFGILPSVQRLVESTGWPTWTSPFGKGLLNETLPNVHRIYRGQCGDPVVHNFIRRSDLVLCFGPHLSSSNTYGYTSIMQRRTIFFTEKEIDTGAQVFPIPMREAVILLEQKLDMSRVVRYWAYPILPRDSSEDFSNVDSAYPITQDKFWRIISTVIQPGDIVLGETGTAGYGCQDMPLPLSARMFLPVTWLSTGYTLGAAQGAALAMRELSFSPQYHCFGHTHTILFIGDGSFQMVAQELGTIIRLGLDVILFLINNGGYTSERCHHGLDRSYNDVSRWRYLQAPSFFGAGLDTFTASVSTWGELNELIHYSLQNARGRRGLKMVEVVMDCDDAPRGPLLQSLQRQREEQWAAVGLGIYQW